MLGINDEGYGYHPHDRVGGDSGLKLHTDDDVLLELSAVLDDRGPPGDNCSTWHGGQAYEGREAK